jgi:ribosomal protein S18 acetylase RimI-like enzyme
VPYRGKGYSKLLMEEAIKEFKNSGYSDVRLNVYAHNQKAMKLYEQMGFKDVSKFMKISL